MAMLSLQVDRAVELTVQHVAKLREMSPLWEMVQVCWQRAHATPSALRCMLQSCPGTAELPLGDTEEQPV
jgi:hypothetical protein